MPVKKKSYLEYYRDPRWQKKRLEVMERDGFKCVECGDNDNTLNVHHCYYEDGKRPWEYETRSLVTLCESCHEEERNLIKIARKEILRTFGKHGLRSVDIWNLEVLFQVGLKILGKEKFDKELQALVEKKCHK